ncbi:MAG: type II secretion system GspH family protein [Colwellia sp.]
MNKSPLYVTNKVTSFKNGFTLIELMISISILTLLLFIGAYSYSLMSERWNKELGKFSSTAKTAKHLELLQHLVEGVQPYVVVDDQKKPSLFFIGNKTSLLAVSRAGLFSDEFPEIFRLTTVEKENGKVDFIYQSASTKNILLTGTNQEIIFDKKLILFSNLDQVMFRYYGWSHLYIKNAIDKSVKKPQWFERYSGIDNQLIPEKYIITLTKEGENLTIPVTLETNPERWLAPYYKENQ